MIYYFILFFLHHQGPYWLYCVSVCACLRVCQCLCVCVRVSMRVCLCDPVILLYTHITRPLSFWLLLQQIISEQIIVFPFQEYKTVSLLTNSIHPTASKSPLLPTSNPPYFPTPIPSYPFPPPIPPHLLLIPPPSDHFLTSPPTIPPSLPPHLQSLPPLIYNPFLSPAKLSPSTVCVCMYVYIQVC